MVPKRADRLNEETTSICAYRRFPKNLTSSEKSNISVFNSNSIGYRSVLDKLKMCLRDITKDNWFLFRPENKLIFIQTNKVRRFALARRRQQFVYYVRIIVINEAEGTPWGATAGATLGEVRNWKLAKQRHRTEGKNFWRVVMPERRRRIINIT